MAPRTRWRATSPPNNSEDTSIVILAFVALGLGVVIAVSGLVYARRLRDSVAASREVETARLHEERGAAEQERASIVLAAREEAHRLRSESEAEVRERRGVVIRFYVALANAIIIVRRLVREAWKRYRWDTRPRHCP